MYRSPCCLPDFDQSTLLWICDLSMSFAPWHRPNGAQCAWQQYILLTVAADTSHGEPSSVRSRAAPRGCPALQPGRLRGLGVDNTQNENGAIRVGSINAEMGTRN